MDVKEYDYSRIIDINSNGLIYIDDLGNKCFVDFSDCRRNWVKHVNISNEYSRNDLNEEDTRCVGERDICANPKYFEFYSKHKIRFIFQCKKGFIAKFLHFQSKSSKQFLKLQFDIKKVGWSTFDLT